MLIGATKLQVEADSTTVEKGKLEESAGTIDINQKCGLCSCKGAAILLDIVDGVGMFHGRPSTDGVCKATVLSNCCLEPGICHTHTNKSIRASPQNFLDYNSKVWYGTKHMYNFTDRGCLPH